MNFPWSNHPPLPNWTNVSFHCFSFVSGASDHWPCSNACMCVCVLHFANVSVTLKRKIIMKLFWRHFARAWTSRGFLEFKLEPCQVMPSKHWINVWAESVASSESSTTLANAGTAGSPDPAALPRTIHSFVLRWTSNGLDKMFAFHLPEAARQRALSCCTPITKRS